MLLFRNYPAGGRLPYIRRPLDETTKHPNRCDQDHTITSPVMYAIYFTRKTLPVARATIKIQARGAETPSMRSWCLSLTTSTPEIPVPPPTLIISRTIFYVVNFAFAVRRFL
jgi:hypothetical protein